MSKTVIKLNTSGVRELLKSPEMEQGIGEMARQIAQRAGDGYESDTKKMGTRVIASTYTNTRSAYYKELKNNTLLKAVQ